MNTMAPINRSVSLISYSLLREAVEIDLFQSDYHAVSSPVMYHNMHSLQINFPVRTALSCGNTNEHNFLYTVTKRTSPLLGCSSRMRMRRVRAC